MPNIHTSNMSKQFLGAFAGMTIAVGVYFVVNQVSDVRGLLVSTKTISTSTDVSINAKDVDDSTFRRIQSRAQTVADALKNSETTAPAETPLTNLASSRRAARQFAVELKQLAANAETYENKPNIEVTQRERLALRTERVAEVQMHQGAGPAPRDTNLPSSGLGLNLLVLITLAIAFVTSKTTWRTRCASILSELRIG